MLEHSSGILGIPEQMTARYMFFGSSSQVATPLVHLNLNSIVVVIHSPCTHGVPDSPLPHGSSILFWAENKFWRRHETEHSFNLYCECQSSSHQLSVFTGKAVVTAHPRSLWQEYVAAPEGDNGTAKQPTSKIASLNLGRIPSKYRESSTVIVTLFCIDKATSLLVN